MPYADEAGREAYEARQQKALDPVILARAKSASDEDGPMWAENYRP